MDGQERRATKTLLDYWQLLLVLCGGIVACVTFYNKVNDVIAEQKAFKATVEDRRTKSRDDLEAVRLQLAVQKNDIEWMKKEK